MDRSSNNLPLQLTSFIGREREIATVKAQFTRSRLVTLTGAGGSGKTRLAIQVAADLIESFADGVWFVDLAPLSEESVVPQAVLAALGVPEAPARPIMETLTEFLRSRTTLLVLDNCEHLVEACARLVDTLLHACSRLTVLATSREMLGVAGEAAWRVPSLSLPAALPDTPSDGARPGLATYIERYEAVRLFVERARLVQPGFEVTWENAPALIEVCRRLDGMPLAIELAAARARVLSVEQIAARLNDRFRLLTGGSRTALRRHQTLRALVDWSYDLLGGPERALLRRLAVFAGGWTLGAAEAVCSDFGLPIVDFGVRERPDEATAAPSPPPQSKIQNPKSTSLICSRNW